MSRAGEVVLRTSRLAEILRDAKGNRNKERDEKDNDLFHLKDSPLLSTAFLSIILGEPVPALRLSCVRFLRRIAA